MQKPELPPHFARRNARGLIELVDMNNGRILCVQATDKDLLATKWENLTCIHTPEGPVWIEKCINFDIVPTLSNQPYSKMLGDLLAQGIVEGKSLVTACIDLNLEYSTVMRWKRTHEEFAEQLKEARRDRAEAFHDEVLETARTQARTKDKIAALQWAAEKGNPEIYGNKTKIVGDKDAPIQFVLATGINRDVTPTPEELPPGNPPESQGKETEIEEYGG